MPRYLASYVTLRGAGRFSCTLESKSNCEDAMIRSVLILEVILDPDH